MDIFWGQFFISKLNYEPLKIISPTKLHKYSRISTQTKWVYLRIDIYSFWGRKFDLPIIVKWSITSNVLFIGTWVKNNTNLAGKLSLNSRKLFLRTSMGSTKWQKKKRKKKHINWEKSFQSFITILLYFVY